MMYNVPRLLAAAINEVLACRTESFSLSQVDVSVWSRGLILGLGQTFLFTGGKNSASSSLGPDGDDESSSSSAIRLPYLFLYYLFNVFFI